MVDESSVSQSYAPSRTKIVIGPDFDELRALLKCAKEDESGKHFLARIEAISKKLLLPVTDLLENISYPRSEDTLLHVAVKNGRKEVVNVICELVPSLLTRKNAVGDTVWHITATTGHLGVFMCLQEHRIKIAGEMIASPDDGSYAGLSDVNVDENTALHVALINHKEEIAIILHEENPQLCKVVNNEKRNGIYLAAQAGFLKLLQSMDWSDSSTAKQIIHASIVGKKIDVLKYTMDRFPSLFSTLHEKKNALHTAVACGFLDGLKFFINLYGIEVATAKVDDYERCLMSDNCDFGAANLKLNILHVAALNGEHEVVSYILDGPDFQEMLNEPDEDGNTPLHLAAMNCHPLATDVLAWNANVDLTHRNNEELNALEAAELYTRRFSSFQKWLTLSSMRAAGMRSSSPFKPNYPTRKMPDSAASNLSERTRKQVTNILVVMLAFVALSAFVGAIATSHIQTAYNLSNSRSLRSAAFCNQSILLSSTLITPSLILLQHSKHLQNVIFRLVVPFLKTSVTIVLLQVLVSFYLAVQWLDRVTSTIYVAALCLIGFLIEPFFPLRLPVLFGKRIIVRRITYYPIRLFIYFSHSL